MFMEVTPCAPATSMFKHLYLWLQAVIGQALKGISLLQKSGLLKSVFDLCTSVCS